MKRIFAAAIFACIALFAGAQDIPAGIRMEITEVEQDDNQFTIFTYKDEDGTFAYYLSLGRELKLIEVADGEDGIFNASLSHVDETCVWLGTTYDEAMGTLEHLLTLFDKEPGYSTEFSGRLSMVEKLGKPTVARCVVIKRLLGKHLFFLFDNGRYTANAELTKGTVKSLITAMKFDKKLHPNRQ
ncbi:MAG: hypothetical protein IKX60_07965 [Bacteroidales bacterium]|nr:hypothetical protein [Bacteroidales bacterium]